MSTSPFESEWVVYHGAGHVRIQPRKAKTSYYVCIELNKIVIRERKIPDRDYLYDTSQDPIIAGPYKLLDEAKMALRFLST